MSCEYDPELLHILYSFFSNDTATTHIYTLSLHDALPISRGTFHLRLSAGQLQQPAARALPQAAAPRARDPQAHRRHESQGTQDRKSTRLNSSHTVISYAVFCLKKKNDKRHYSH